jgi:hypothetical protein
MGTVEAKETKSIKNLLMTRSNSMNHANNGFGFDRNGGAYKVIIGDHIAYRYEVIKDIDKGAFGQVVLCIDHKTKEQVAVKINKSMPA